MSADHEQRPEIEPKTSVACKDLFLHTINIQDWDQY